MRSKDFKKILKEETPKKIIFRHTHESYLQNGINLTDKQLQIVIDLKNQQEEKCEK